MPSRVHPKSLFQTFIRFTHPLEEKNRAIAGPFFAASFSIPQGHPAHAPFHTGKFNRHTGVNPVSQQAWEFIIEDPYRLSVSDLVRKFGLSATQFVRMRRVRRQFEETGVNLTFDWQIDKNRFKGTSETPFEYTHPTDRAALYAMSYADDIGQNPLGPLGSHR